MPVSTFLFKECSSDFVKSFRLDSTGVFRDRLLSFASLRLCCSGGLDKALRRLEFCSWNKYLGKVPIPAGAADFSEDTAVTED